MSKATKCDRCGGFYEQGGKNVRQGFGTNMVEFELCADCAEAFDAWMECRPVTGAPERVTNQAEMSHDTREQLEADVREYANPTDAKGTLGASWERKMLGFLDRQAAITERETLHSHPMCAGSDACPASNRPIGESVDRETPDTDGIGASKDEIRDFDVWNVAYEIYCAGGYVDNGNEPNPPTDGIRELLDRQAAITEQNLLDGLQAVGETCSIEWRGESYDTDAGREYDGAYFCTKCMSDLPQPLQECWDDYQALRAHYGNVKPWDEKPFLRCPNCGRYVVDALTAERIGFDCAECAEGLGRELDARCDPLKERIAELQREIATLKEHRAANMERLHELTDECAELRKYRDEWKGIAEAVWAECEGYRAKLGAVLDAIREAERAAR